MRKKHRRQEKIMEAPQQNNEDFQAEAEAEMANREAAALEEKLMASKVATARMAGEEVVKSMGAKPEEEMLVSMAAKGRDYLIDRIQKLTAERAAQPAYAPPAMTDRQKAAREIEMEAGRRAQAKHAAQEASRPPRPADVKTEGFTRPVYRPGDLVPDPTVPPTIGRDGPFSAGTRVYGPDA